MGYDNVAWFVNGVKKLENKMTYYFKDNNKDIVMTEKDEEDFKKDNLCRFCEKNVESDKVRDHCHLTGKYRGPAQNTCNSIVTQKQSIYIAFIFHKLSNYDCHLFLENLVDKRRGKVEFDIIPKTNEEYISVTYGCIRFIKNYRFLSSSLDSLVKTLVDNKDQTLKKLKKEYVDNDEVLNIVYEIIGEAKTIKDLQKDYPDKIKNLEAPLLKYLGENDL